MQTVWTGEDTAPPTPDLMTAIKVTLVTIVFERVISLVFIEVIGHSVLFVQPVTLRQQLKISPRRALVW